MRLRGGLGHADDVLPPRAASALVHVLLPPEDAVAVPPAKLPLALVARLLVLFVFLRGVVEFPPAFVDVADPLSFVDPPVHPPLDALALAHVHSVEVRMLLVGSVVEADELLR